MCAERFPGVGFHPWIGERYGRTSRFGIRLLVLGESHYGPPGDENVRFTQQVVHHWQEGGNLPFFTKTAQVLLRTENPDDDDTRRRIWEHVAFHNFVQTFVPGPRKRPDDQQWLDARAPFGTVLKELQPDAVLILGKELEKKLEQHASHVLESTNFKAIMHPSSPHFRYRKAIPAFGCLVPEAQTKVAGANGPGRVKCGNGPASDPLTMRQPPA